ncbi:hypothetical protein ACFYYH_11750 [Streptomyces sp. NPDC002018]|uniref:hypothetical protein n=1 Tax=Streptomyces sp. NPDC002018 TaxID=3364629 RepID=UPI0036A1E641
MTEIAMPRWPGSTDAETHGRPPVEPAASEACRLLCAGVHLDGDFRDAVLDELYTHEERFTAPSTGFDAARVLAHALRARRIELAWGVGMLVLWTVAVPLTGGLLLLLVLPSLLLAVAPWIRGRGAGTPWYRKAAALVVRWYGRLSLTMIVVGLVGLAAEGLSDGDTPSGVETVRDTGALVPGISGVSGGIGTFAEPGRAWATLILFALLAAGVGLRRAQFARVMTNELSERRFPAVSSDPAELATGGRLQRLSARIRAEQHAPLVMYHSANPFRGVGEPFRPWTLAVELRPRKDRSDGNDRPDRENPLGGESPLDGESPRDGEKRLGGENPLDGDKRLGGENRSDGADHGGHDTRGGAGAAYGTGGGPVPIDNGEVLRRIVPLLEALRVPSPHGSPEAAAAVRDRLRELRVDECVFLPVDGLTRRDGAPYDAEGFARHRADSREEGGEARRHFLRIRVGGWHEELVVTVFVRVHTQGGMLMLEVAPHVLLPVRRQFREADRLAHQYLNNSWPGKAVWALVHTPGSIGQTLLTLGRYAAVEWRRLTGGYGGALPAGPAVSIRELGSDNEVSLFQEMDVSRYLKSVEDRVAGGVRQALYEAGWQTAEFEQKIVNVASGGVFIESAQDSAIGIGDHNTIGNRNEAAGGSNGRK